MRLAIAALTTAVLALTPAAALAQDEEDRCGPRKQGEQCGEGNGRQTPGGGDTGNVSHKGWPKITGILWKVLDSRDHERTGTEDNDELLGHHGDDNDLIYPSHGKNNMYGGAGNDRIIAYYGHGVIDCGPGTGDYAQTRWQSNAYKVRNCERIRHFCAFGSKPNGDCKKPGENAFAVLSRQASHKALLAFLDAW